MAYGIILEFTGIGKKEYDAVNQKLGIDMAAGTGDLPAGLESHAGGTTPGGGFVVYEVWDTKATQEAFMAGQLGVALGAAGVPDPVRVTEVDIVGFHTP